MIAQQKRRCIIVGAGVAGMSAAMHCVSSGLQPVVIEAKPYLGGRAHSFLDKTTSEYIDNGQHLLMGCYHVLLGMLKELGTEKQLRAQDSLKVTFLDAHGPPDIFHSMLFRGSAGRLEAVLRLQHCSLKSKWRAIRMMLRLKKLNSGEIHISCTQFLKEQKQTPEFITRFWEPIILATLNSPPDKASAKLFVEVLMQSILAGERESALIIPQHALSTLFEPFIPWIHSHGAEVHLRTEAKELIYIENSIVGIATGDDREIRADAVILALPPKELYRVAAECIDHHQYFSLVHSFTNSPIVSVYMWFDRDFMSQDFCAVLNTTIQWVFNRRKLCVDMVDAQSPFKGHISLTVSAAASLAERSAETLVQHCLAELQLIFPECKTATLLHYKVIKERSATVLFTPHTESLRPSVTTPLRGLFIAGDWTDTGLPATLEGAARSGRDAADAVIRSLNGGVH